MYFHPINPEHSTAQSILNAIRPDRFFTDEEAKLLDLCMVLHAEHGGGNNSTFTARGALVNRDGHLLHHCRSHWALKGPRHWRS